MDTSKIKYLCNYDDKISETEDEIIKTLWSGNWIVENSELCAKLLETNLDMNTLKKVLGDVPEQDVLEVAISSFLTFIERNWNPLLENKLENYFGTPWPEGINAANELQRDSECIYTHILNPELLFFSTQVFNALNSVKQNLLNLWWLFRIKVTHQRCLEDNSATLYSELEVLIAKLTNEMSNIHEKPRLQILLNLEIAQAYLIYGRVQKVEEYLARAKEFAGLKLELTGILGKRTKFQQHELAQIALTTELDASILRPSSEESHGNSALPHDMELQDDVRLNRIQYSENVNQTELPSLEQILCLLTVQYLQKSQPKDDLMEEEIRPYIDAVLSQKTGAWATRVSALLLRCKLEANHKRTIERAMMQCDSIVHDKTQVASTSRLSYLWATGLQPSWTWRQQLADLYLSLGLVKSALEEYLKLELWEDVIVCYSLLQLSHKAAEIIQQQIEVCPTVKLYCLLGDATGNEDCYEQAWKFSNEKSSRAQRHWGNHLYFQKNYAECIPHYEKSVEINSIQETVWLRLGYAALVTENWETSAKAYRRYTYLQPNTFEAWNNLAKVYVKQGDKHRAYRALLEALRFKYDSWKVWENVVVISIDTGHFEDVLRGCHRILDIQHKFEDTEVLTLLVRAVLQDCEDADGNKAGRLRNRVLELFGRITSIHQNNPDIWQLYSDISPTYLLKGQRLLKAYRGYTQAGNWSNNPETCKKVIELVQSLLRYSLEARQEAEEKDKLQADQQLSSARLTGQAVLRAAEKQEWPETKDAIVELEDLFNKVTDYIKSNL